MSIHIREQAAHACATFQGQFGSPTVMIDRRAGIGPHHLAIGKTRKVFEHDGTVYAFFSRGYEIACAEIDARTKRVRDIRALDIPTAWGGGAFCVDCDAEGRVVLAFLHRNQHELAFVEGQIAECAIDWSPWRTLLASSSHQAAPWVELSPDGTAWCSVLDRAGDFRIALVLPDGETRVANLFKPGETPWYHSCVQMLPVGKGRALAVGFRGSFPSKTELVFKTVSEKLEFGPSTVLAPCNVNDRLTFHFQAVGDAAHGSAHIVYLDEGLSVSYARYTKGAWEVTKSVLPFACFAPQITIDNEGDLVLLAADYEGRVWKAAKPVAGSWSEPVPVVGLEGPNISALFAMTSYGTGGIIAAARSDNGRVPFLLARIENGESAEAELDMGLLGAGHGHALAANRPISAVLNGNRLEAEIRLSDLSRRDLADASNSWVVNVPAETSSVLKLCIKGGDAMSATASWFESDGRVTPAASSTTIEMRCADAFSPERHAAIRVTAELKNEPRELHTAKASVETYAGARLIDIAPFQPETAARMTLAPHAIPKSFKRMV
jgi:hypothetical protein